MAIKKDGKPAGGYIAIYRTVKDHWIYEKGRKRTKYEAWLDLVMMASYEGTEKPIGYDNIMLERGQLLTSQEKLGIEWRWDRSSVRAFLNSLQNQQMISQQTTSKYTIITICNYDSYQNTQPALRPTNRPHFSQPNHHIQESNKIISNKEGYSAEQIEKFERFEKWVAEKANAVSNMDEPFDIGQFWKLKEKYSTEQIMELVTRMSNYKPLNKTNKSAYLTFINWAKKDFNMPTPILQPQQTTGAANRKL